MLASGVEVIVFFFFLRGFIYVSICIFFCCFAGRKRVRAIMTGPGLDKAGTGA